MIMKDIYILLVTLYSCVKWICNCNFFCICFVYFYSYILKITREDHVKEILIIDCQTKNISFVIYSSIWNDNIIKWLNQLDISESNRSR